MAGDVTAAMRAGSVAATRPPDHGRSRICSRLMDVFRTPDERFEDLPGFGFEPNYADVDGLRLHYVDEAPQTGGADAPPRRTIVCFHGEPTWAFLYRKMLGPLVEAGHRVICPD